MFYTIIVLFLVGFGIGGGIGYFFRIKKLQEYERNVQEKCKRDLQEAQSKGKEMVFDAKNEAFKIQEEAKKEERSKRIQLEKMEGRILEKEENLDKKLGFGRLRKKHRNFMNSKKDNWSELQV